MNSVGDVPTQHVEVVAVCSWFIAADDCDRRAYRHEKLLLLSLFRGAAELSRTVAATT